MCDPKTMLILRYNVGLIHCQGIMKPYAKIARTEIEAIQVGNDDGSNQDCAATRRLTMIVGHVSRSAGD